MAEKRYVTDDDVIDAVSSYVKGLSKKFYLNGIKTLQRPC